jgi:hypothetical protein
MRSRPWCKARIGFATPPGPLTLVDLLRDGRDGANHVRAPRDADALHRRASAMETRRGTMPYAVNLALRWQIEWLCTYLTISKQLVEMMVGPGRQPVKSTFPIPVPVPAKAAVPMKPAAMKPAAIKPATMKKVSCIGPADLKA